jgi:hypothetical protein
MPNAQPAKQSQPQSPARQKNNGRLKLILILAGCGVLILIALVIIFAGHSNVNENINSNVNKKSVFGQVVDVAEQTQGNFSDQVDLAIFLEDELGLKEVLVSQDGKNILVRFMAPTISGNELNRGIVQVFAFVNQKVSDDIVAIKLIFTVNHVDSMIVTAQRKDISLWMKKKISNEQFIKKFDVVSLIK